MVPSAAIRKTVPRSAVPPIKVVPYKLPSGIGTSDATGTAPSAIGRHFDTVTLCLSKGLGCPLGALLGGSAETIERAWREKHLFGGAMRQAGIVAAAGVYALDHHVDRLAEDHARARRLYRSSSSPS